ncbi:hypothetical protein EVAR_83635_1 [Eumeta japonica]|uniref:Uncharacterized protein n=1 Tax=Eumeta variegata TaxID=151549 RepID=A0A4C1UQ85_EUMVA|nr:hypothetical protein EVAR_83635_1 [Eumeta japonica]
MERFHWSPTPKWWFWVTMLTISDHALLMTRRDLYTVSFWPTAQSDDDDLESDDFSVIVETGDMREFFSESLTANRDAERNPAQRLLLVNMRSPSRS